MPAGVGRHIVRHPVHLECLPRPMRRAAFDRLIRSAAPPLRSGYGLYPHRPGRVRLKDIRARARATRDARSLPFVSCRLPAISVMPRVIPITSPISWSMSRPSPAAALAITPYTAAWIAPEPRVRRVACRQPGFLDVQQTREIGAAELVADGRAYHPIQRDPPIGLGGGFAHLLHERRRFPRDQGERDRILVGEILVERTDADAGTLRHRIGRVTLQSPRLENASRCLDDCLHRLSRARLPGGFPRFQAVGCRASGHCGKRV